MSEQIVEVSRKIPEQLMEVPKKKKSFFTFELFIVIMLGITAICTAWASWVGSVHASNQNESFTISNNISTEAITYFNLGTVQRTLDAITYDNLNDINLDIELARLRGDTDAVDILIWKRSNLIGHNVSDNLYNAIVWANEQAEIRDENVSPFENEEFMDGYFTPANELLSQSEHIFNDGRQHGSHSRSFGLATVIYAVVLFLLGVDNSFKTWRYRFIVFLIAIAAFLFATVYMFTIPLPEGLFG
ncbi:MAG: hypothetical protein LBC71_05790 [Oscillospiraceae bacterium]|jgi:hypothetical protein|nr:hypothetical protein [Oscillospiraceae bacterium]